jgi:hypothetical protein
MAKRIKDGNQALALLMSVPNLDERRNLVAEDVEGDRSFSAINPLSLALVLAAPFGVSREWRSLCRRRPVGAEHGVRPYLLSGEPKLACKAPISVQVTTGYGLNPLAPH